MPVFRIANRPYENIKPRLRNVVRASICDVVRLPAGLSPSPPKEDIMQIGIYGSGYLGTVISACLADFGTPVTCYDEDSTSIQSIADGNIPFYERNLKDILRRNIRAGRLNYSTDIESFAKRADIIFLASDSYKYVEELAVRLGKLTRPDSTLVIMTPVPVGLASRVEKSLQTSGSKMAVVSQPMFFTDGCAVED